MRKILYLMLCLRLFGTASAQTIFQTQPLAFDGLTTIDCTFYDSLTERMYFAGQIQTVNGDSANLVYYDGTTFHTMQTPLLKTKSIVRYKDHLYFAGISYSTPTGGGHSLIRWDGAQWEYMDSVHSSIYRIKVIDDKLFVLGSRMFFGNDTFAGAAVFEGNEGRDTLGLTQFIGTDGWTVSDMVHFKGKTYVSANWYDSQYPLMEDLMVHDGSQWQQVGNFMVDGMGNVRKLLVWRDTLYVGGEFSEPISPGNCIAAWDGSNWHRLQNGLKQFGQAAVTDM